METKELLHRILAYLSQLKLTLMQKLTIACNDLVMANDVDCIIGKYPLKNNCTGLFHWAFSRKG